MSANGWSVIVEKSRNWRTPFSPDYLDETTSFKAECDIKWHAARGGEYKPVLRESLDYLSKETFGQVHVGGFLYDLVSENPKGSPLQHSAPQTLSNAERKKRIRQQWQLHSEGNSNAVTEDIRHKFTPLKTTQHRLVFSLDAQFTSECRKKSLNPDLVIQNIVKQSLRNFTAEFHPGDSLGYAYGIHHDTDNLHVHVFVHPRTKLGARVGFSQQLKRFKIENGQKNTLGFLNQAALTQARQWEARLADPQKFEAWKKKPNNARYFIAPSHGQKFRAEIKKAVRVANNKAQGVRVIGQKPLGKAPRNVQPHNPYQQTEQRLQRRYDDLSEQIHHERQERLKQSWPRRMAMIQRLPQLPLAPVSKEARDSMRLVQNLAQLFAQGVIAAKRVRMRRMQQERLGLITSLKQARAMKRITTPRTFTQTKPYDTTNQPTGGIKLAQTATQRPVVAKPTGQNIRGNPIR